LLGERKNNYKLLCFSGTGELKLSTCFTEALKRLEQERSYKAYLLCSNVLKEVDPENFAKGSFSLAVLSNYTIHPLIPVLQVEIAQLDYYPQIFISNYDSVASEILDASSSLHSFKADAIILSLWLENLTPKLANQFVSLSISELDSEINHILTFIGDMIKGLRRKTVARIFLNNFPLLRYNSFGILEGQQNHNLKNTIGKLNNEIFKILQNYQDVYLVDYFSLFALMEGPTIDNRLWHMNRAPLSRNMLIEMGREYGKFFRALTGKTKKCLVLDCDNTLWGGIVGEDGIKGIKIGKEYPGSCYQEFQREILNLHNRGIILALCSKNNEEDILEIFDSHPEMILKKENFACWKINWENKASNIEKISEELNIDLDSFVFVDDSQFECDFVRDLLPQVSVIQLSSNPSSYVEKLRTLGLFDALSLSEEDKKRNQMYRSEVERKKAKSTSASYEEYLKELNIFIEVGLVDTIKIPRISQLTQKTNQFNLTTQRYSEGEIEKFLANENKRLFYTKVSDRISEIGIVGFAILDYDYPTAKIETFLLSCRVLGRKVEDVLLKKIMKTAKKQGFTRLIGIYNRTKKNAQVELFYQKYGFSNIIQTTEYSEWEYFLEEEEPKYPPYIRVKEIEKE
jgi:FkbH-like protein